MTTDIQEGFLCPECFMDLECAHNLELHFRIAHNIELNFHDDATQGENNITARKEGPKNMCAENVDVKRLNHLKLSESSEWKMGIPTSQWYVDISRDEKAVTPLVRDFRLDSFYYDDRHSNRSKKPTRATSNGHSSSSRQKNRHTTKMGKIGNNSMIRYTDTSISQYSDTSHNQIFTDNTFDGEFFWET